MESRYQLHHGDCLEVLKTLPDCSVDAVVTDPPYGLSFMGKRWDYDVPAVEVWQECLRVLKPGGHLLAFAGTRTQHRMAVRIEDAGFEIRDLIAWVYGSGFPKSLDVSKAIDKGSGENRDRQLRFTAWMRSTGITADQINEATQTSMASHYLTDKSQPAIATADLFDKLRPYLPEVPEEIERLVCERTGIEWTAYKLRRVVGKGTGGISTRKDLKIDNGTVWGAKSSEFNITAPATEAAKQWQGWGTALKPAFEPITMARKPFASTVAANVLEHGTGGLNVDGCRVPSEDVLPKMNGKAILGGSSDGWDRPWKNSEEGLARRQAAADKAIEKANELGRWPANFIHDGSEEVLQLFPVTKSGSILPHHQQTSESTKHSYEGGYAVKSMVSHGDQGSAARFFYTAKASKADRDAGREAMELRVHQSGMGGAMPIDDEGCNRDRFKAASRNHHPTVKPTDLMRYLCRLVTPPGGIILDPFTGSGSTGKAAILEGFRFIGIERESEYIEIARARIQREADKPRQPTLFD